MKKFEFSKIIIVCVGSITLIVTIFSMIATWKMGDTSPLAYLIPAVFGELATATAFYYNKAKAENKIKLSNWYHDEDEDEDNECELESKINE